MKELFDNIVDENIIDEDLMAHDDHSFKEEMPEEVESFIDEMLNSDRHHEVHTYDVWFYFDNLEKTIPDVVEEMLHIDGHETIYAIGDRKPQHYGTADADWQKIRIAFDSGSTVDVMPNDELCQVEVVPCTGSRANRTMFAANGTKIESQGEKKFKVVTD